MIEKQENKFGVVAAMLAIIVALSWGGNFAASKMALLHFPPFYVIFIRYVLVTLLLLPFAFKAKLNMKQMFILSVLMISLHFTLVFSALWLGLDISTTVIAIQLGVPFSCVLGAIFLNDKLGAWRTLGMAIAFMGVMLVAGEPSVTENELAFLLAILGCLAWAGSNIYMKVVGSAPIMPLLFWTGFWALPVTLSVSLIIESDHLALLESAPMSAWAGVLYSTLISTILGYGLWYYLLRTYSVTQIVPFSLLVPIGGFASGYFFFDERLTLTMAIGAAITIVGVAIITIRKPGRVGRVGKI